MQTAAHSSPGTNPLPKAVRVLLVPAEGSPAKVTTVADSARAISDALGRYLLDDSTIGALSEGSWFTLYLADGGVSTLPDNPRAAALAARLGLVDRRLQARMRGPVLVAGLDPDTGADVDVPASVLAAAEQTGLRVTEAGPRW